MSPSERAGATVQAPANAEVVATPISNTDCNGVDVIETVDAEIVDLAMLAAEANKYHAEARNHAGNMLEAAWYAGNALNSAKAQCKHGEWLPWLEANFDGSVRNAENYMRIAKTQTSADLASSQSIDKVLKGLSKPRKGRSQPLSGTAFSKRFGRHVSQMQKSCEALEKLCKRPDFSAHIDHVYRDHYENVECLGNSVDRVKQRMYSKQLPLFESTAEQRGWW
jgi:hypothetical protein